MYNYPAYGQPPGFSGYAPPGGQAPGMGAPGMPPPGMMAPPGMSAPPGMAPPGASFPPGMNQAQHSLPGRPGGLPPNFQPPTNMPNINFNAPVIRLGTAGPGKDASRAADPMGARRGLGDSRGGIQQPRESMQVLTPPTREEIFRTIFVGNITEGVGGDVGMERILRSAGNLRKWTRASDADGKWCKFGFAEYEDAESLETAAEVLKDVQVPLKRREPGTKTEDEEVEKATLLVIVDEASKQYAAEWHEKRGDQASDTQFRIDTAKEQLEGVLASLFNPSANDHDHGGDIRMQEDRAADPITGEVITIPLSTEDELADIPAEMRETVAAEIAAFRDRSTRRDLERLRREEEMEAKERNNRGNRQTTPPASTPAGPMGGANGIPLGPRERGVQGAPSGPKGMHKDHQNGVTFVNGGPTVHTYISREEEESDASDEELEHRRRAKKDAELEKVFHDMERRWLSRERSRTAAIEREKARERDEISNHAREKETMALRLKNWNDDLEASRKSEEYYADRSQWIRNRAAFRAQEAERDGRDRAQEERELAREREKQDIARDAADSFLQRQAEELGARGVQPAREPQHFKMSLGAAAQKAQAAAAPKRRTVAEVEGLLEDEEDVDTNVKRQLVPIQFDSAAEAAALTDEERLEAQRRLAQEIPTETQALWDWNVKWEFVDATVINEQLKPFVEKKIVEYLGVQEQMLVDVVEEHLRNKKRPEALVGELEGALDEMAEDLVRKLWRMIIFFSESEKRGLSG
ncbi:hypothetical protein EJ06DRAFT_527049 [Trichodelitschia bisporula]|uniref:PWI domain-containing protein n=1 Tax=Trichodelitschia bisporula TaxID=703511 RepID=A0A6G1I549_9PEZI|nr:hypothetical protein EJ06DRAFT_527049 [Trichodelitschia bisporula]